jgi:acyl-coenzyme A thioesterase PaaI-like protein
LTFEATRAAPSTSAGEDRPAIETPDGRFEFAEHNCFACGTLNAGGLGLVLHVEPGRSWSDVTLDNRFEGWERLIHGGIVSTILDEVMAWALVGEDNWGVTARMAVDFRRPILVGMPVHAEGWITRSRRRVVDTAGHIVDPATGVELATATGVYVAAGTKRKQDLQEKYAYRRAGDANRDAASAAPDSRPGTSIRDDAEAGR